MTDDNDPTHNLTTLGFSLMDELADRLETELSAKDRLAIGTAVWKASVRGFKLGAVFATDVLSQQCERAGLDVTLTINVTDDSDPEERDAWAEEYDT